MLTLQPHIHEALALDFGILAIQEARISSEQALGINSLCKQNNFQLMWGTLPEYVRSGKKVTLDRSTPGVAFLVKQNFTSQIVNFPKMDKWE